MIDQQLVMIDTIVIHYEEDLHVGSPNWLGQHLPPVHHLLQLRQLPPDLLSNPLDLFPIPASSGRV